jgi:GT2 family glycosyltransferase
MKNKKNPKVAAIVLTINLDEDHLKFPRNCLKTIKETNYSNLVTYVSDNASPKKFHEKLKKEFPWAKFILNKSNLGFATGNNVAARKSLKEENPDYIILLNDDNEFPDKNWLKKMIFESEKRKEVGVIGCRNIFPDGTDQWFSINGKVDFYKLSGHKEKDKGIFKNQIIKEVVGNCFLIKRELIDKIGLLDDK